MRLLKARSAVGRLLSWCKTKLARKRAPSATAATHGPDLPWPEDRPARSRYRIDRLIEVVAPQWGAQRRIARMALAQVDRSEQSIERLHGRREQLIGYREGHQTPRNRQVYGRGSAPDYLLELGYGDRRSMVDEARSIEMVNSIAQSVLDRAGEHVIGEGLTLKCKTNDEGWNREMEAYWLEWCRGACDSRGQMTFHEMLTLVFRSWLRDGDVGAVLERDGSMRLVESDEIASKVGGYTRPSDADGVELDRRGRIVAYWVFDYDPTVLWADRRTAISRLVRVPAEDMIFLARRQRIGQTRGLSAFAGAGWIFETLDDNLESAATALHMSACAGLVVEKKTAVTGNRAGGAELKMSPGGVHVVGPGEKITSVQPTHPGDGFDRLMARGDRIISARFGTSLELVNYDFTNANYSNMRAQSQETAKKSRITQCITAMKFCRDAYGWKLANAIRTGEMRPPKSLKRIGLHRWHGSGLAWQDPEVELRAAMGSVDGVMDTRTNQLARRGLDFFDVVDTIAEENAYLRKKGLPDCRSAITRDAIPTTKSISDPQPAGKKMRQLRARIVKVEKAKAARSKSATRALEALALAVRRDPAPPQLTVNVAAAAPAAAPEVHNHVTVEAPSAPPPAEVTVNVDVDAEIKAGGKGSRVTRDSDGRIVGTEPRES